MNTNVGAFTAAITALEGQRTAYHRYARMVETERVALAKRHPDELLGLARRAGEEFVQLETGSRELLPTLESARSSAVLDPNQADELERTLESVRREALRAEQQIRELMEELEKWRDDLGRRLQDAGEELPGRPAPRGYGSAPPTRSFLLDRQG